MISVFETAIVLYDCKCAKRLTMMKDFLTKYGPLGILTMLGIRR